MLARGHLSDRSAGDPGARRSETPGSRTACHSSGPTLSEGEDAASLDPPCLNSASYDGTWDSRRPCRNPNPRLELSSHTVSPPTHVPLTATSYSQSCGAWLRVTRSPPLHRQSRRRPRLGATTSKIGVGCLKACVRRSSAWSGRGRRSIQIWLARQRRGRATKMDCCAPVRRAAQRRA